MDDILNYESRQEDDYYFILGCTENATEEQISAEYKARVLSCHPDKNPNNESSYDQFAKLSQAKEVLLDPIKRKEYDNWRHSGITMPFETWKSRPQMKTSMHWGFKKEQIAINQDSMPSSSKSTNESRDVRKKSPSHYIPGMDFVHREQHTDPAWERDTSNPMLQKFRNYEI